MVILETNLYQISYQEPQLLPVVSLIILIRYPIEHVIFYITVVNYYIIIGKITTKLTTIQMRILLDLKSDNINSFIKTKINK